jgi:hypothetical protein
MAAQDMGPKMVVVTTQSLAIHGMCLCPSQRLSKGCTCFILSRDK